MFNKGLFFLAANALDLEIVFLFGIFLIQTYSSFSLAKKIRGFSGIFNSKKTLIENEVVVYQGQNSVMGVIKETINDYLTKNRGGVVDFHILKDIVDRNVDNADDEISNGLSTPLYLGLVGTMIGIVVSLWTLDLSPPPSGASPDLIIAAQALDLSPLINGIKMAMFVSAIGLILTTILSVVLFRDAKKAVNGGKNQFLSLLQTELLPSLVKSEGAAMQELSSQLGHFSRNTPEYIESLQLNTDKLNENLISEIDLVNKIHALDIREMSNSNIRVFDHLSEMMNSFESFPAYYNELNSSLGNTIALNNNLKDLIERTNNVGTVINELKEIIETGQEATEFFNAHIQDFSRYGDAVNRAVADTDKRISDALEKLDESVKKQYDSFGAALTSYDSKLSNAFEESIKKLNQAYAEATPNFKKLDELSFINKKLDSLESLSAKIEAFFEEIRRQYNKSGDRQEVINFPNNPMPLPPPIVPVKKMDWYDYLKDGLFITSCISVIGFVVYFVFFFKGF